MKLPKADGQYDIKAMRLLISEMRRLMAGNPTIDSASAVIMINNLVSGIEYSVNTIEFMKKQEQMDVFMKLGMGSHAKN